VPFSAAKVFWSLQVASHFNSFFTSFLLNFIFFLQFSNFILQILIKNVDTQIRLRYTLNIDSKGAAD